MMCCCCAHTDKVSKSKLERAARLFKDVTETLESARKKSGELTFQAEEKRTLQLAGSVKKVDFDVTAGLPAAVAASNDLAAKRVYWGKATDALEAGNELVSKLPAFTAKYQKDAQYAVTVAPTITVAEVGPLLEIHSALLPSVCLSEMVFRWVCVCVCRVH